MQKGHFTKLSMRTGSSSMSPMSFARTTGESYSPASILTSAFFPSLSGEYVTAFWIASAISAVQTFVGSFSLSSSLLLLLNFKMLEMIVGSDLNVIC